MKWRNVLIVVLVTLPLVALLAYGFGRDPRAVPSVLPGRAVPTCALAGLDGERVALDEPRGKPVVLNFWSTWCVPCETEHHLLQQAAQAMGDRVRFLGVIYEDAPAAVRKYVARKGSAYPQLIDPNSRCAIEFGVAGVPETFFIDRSGRIAAKHVGALTESALGSSLRDLLGAQ